MTKLFSTIASQPLVGQNIPVFRGLVSCLSLVLARLNTTLWEAVGQLRLTKKYEERGKRREIISMEIEPKPCPRIITRHPRRHLSPPCPPLSWLKSGWVESERDSQSVIDIPPHLFSRQPAPTVSLSSTPSRPDGHKCREGPELVSMAPANQEQPAPPFRLEGPLTKSSQHPLLISKVVSESMSPSPLYPGMRRPCAAFNRAMHRPGAAPLLVSEVLSESMSPSPLYPGMRRPCAAFNRAMRRPRSPFPRWSRT
ncbi:hypothetical protein B0H13DRAFT_1888722 [Mycena leptocephala]|nr:hypothetical protein B0H13DRAFT_1888722 [Mycena leptocephala]